jgi:hypothetical protein
MLGYSFTDPEVVETLRPWFQTRRSRPDYIVLPKGAKSDVEKKRLRVDFGLIVIEYDPEGPDSHPELLQLVELLAALIPQ